MRCPDCGEPVVSGTAQGRLRFSYRGLPLPLPVHFPALFCDHCPRLIADRTTTVIPRDICPDCGGAMQQVTAQGDIRFIADSQPAGLICRLWQNFRRDTEIQATASFCPPCVRIHVRPDTLTEVYFVEGWEDRF
jgi:predicted RNA-binding Zn-ribbon protein involved in translation (DUF1610 family)